MSADPSLCPSTATSCATAPDPAAHEPELSALAAALAALIERHGPRDSGGAMTLVLMALWKLLDVVQRYLATPGGIRLVSTVPAGAAALALAPVSSPEAPAPAPAGADVDAQGAAGDEGELSAPRASRAPDIAALEPLLPLGPLHRRLAQLTRESLALLSEGEASLAKVQSGLAYTTQDKRHDPDRMQRALYELLDAREQTRFLSVTLCELSGVLTGEISQAPAMHMEALTDLLTALQTPAVAANAAKLAREAAAEALSEAADDVAA